MVVNSNGVVSKLRHNYYSLHMYIVLDTSDFVPSGTIPPTTSTSVLQLAPTAPSETAGELTLNCVEDMLVLQCAHFGLGQTICI